jgi:hypothetical protein
MSIVAETDARFLMPLNREMVTTNFASWNGEQRRMNTMTIGDGYGKGARSSRTSTRLRHGRALGENDQFSRTENRPGGSTVHATRKRVPSCVSKPRMNVACCAG